MPDIKLVIRVSNDELAALRLGQCDKPNPERVKHMLLAAARSNVRNIFARVDEARATRHKMEREMKLHSGKRAAAEAKRPILGMQPKRIKPDANGVIKWEDK